MNKYDHVRNEAAKGQTRHHVCHAEGCDKQVPPAYFMCLKHWRMVPIALQRGIWKHYNAGQETGAADVTAEYLQVAIVAIEVVQKIESSRAQESLFGRRA
jgi:hypothetical protein